MSAFDHSIYLETAQFYLELSKDENLFRYPKSSKRDLVDMAEDIADRWQISDLHAPNPESSLFGVRGVWDALPPGGEFSSKAMISLFTDYGQYAHRWRYSLY